MQVRGVECCSLKPIHDEARENSRLSQRTAQRPMQWPSMSHQDRTRPSSLASFKSSSDSNRIMKLELQAVRNFCIDLRHTETQIAESRVRSVAPAGLLFVNVADHV